MKGLTQMPLIPRSIAGGEKDPKVPEEKTPGPETRLSAPYGTPLNPEDMVR